VQPTIKAERPIANNNPAAIPNPCQLIIRRRIGLLLFFSVEFSKPLRNQYGQILNVFFLINAIND